MRTAKTTCEPGEEDPKLEHVKRVMQNVNSALASWQKQETKDISQEKEMKFLDGIDTAILGGFFFQRIQKYVLLFKKQIFEFSSIK